MTKRTTATDAEQIAAGSEVPWPNDGTTLMERRQEEFTLPRALADKIREKYGAGKPAPFPSAVAAKALDDWFTGYVHGTALSRNTRAYNEAHAAYQRLRGFLSHLDD